MESNKLASLLLRLGIAFSLIYVGIVSFVNPSSWIGFIPSFLQGSTLLIVFSVYEIALGLWLLWGKKIFYASVLTALTMFFIVIFNLGAFDIVFRDLTIMLAAIALAVLTRK
jgi:uncharacterized membrane protein